MPHTSKISFIGVYSDAACTISLANIQVAEIPDLGGFGYSESTVTVNQKQYHRLTGYITVQTLKTQPVFASEWNRYPNGGTVYYKNGASQDVTEKRWETGVIDFTAATIKVGGTVVVQGVTTSVTPERKFAEAYFVRYPYNNRHYIGQIIVNAGRFGDAIPFFGVEDSFWEDAKNNPYSYGTTPKDDGGQGIGDMTSTGVHSSPIPSIGIPTGGRGLHLYKISPAGYQSLQSYLWGEGDTIAKSLWQKFQNKTHNPSNSVVACFRLPAAFMPSAGAAVGVQLAGVNLPTTGTNLVADSLYTHAEITLGAPQQPFLSWLDFSGVTCKIGVPFCGEIAVPAEKVYNKTVMIKYRCDWFNGNIGAAVFAIPAFETEEDKTALIAELTGNVAYNIPVSGGDTGTLDRIGALAAGALQIAAAETGAAAVAGIATAGAGVAGAQYKTYLNNCNTSGSVSSCANGVAYIEFIIPTTAYPYEASQAYAQAYALPAVDVSGVVGDFEGGYGEFDVCRTADGAYIPNATDAEKEEIFRLLKEGVIV